MPDHLPERGVLAADPGNVLHADAIEPEDELFCGHGVVSRQGFRTA